MNTSPTDTFEWDQLWRFDSESALRPGDPAHQSLAAFWLDVLAAKPDRTWVLDIACGKGVATDLRCRDIPPRTLTLSEVEVLAIGRGLDTHTPEALITARARQSHAGATVDMEHHQFSIGPNSSDNEVIAI